VNDQPVVGLRQCRRNLAYALGRYPVALVSLDSAVEEVVPVLLTTAALEVGEEVQGDAIHRPGERPVDF